VDYENGGGLDLFKLGHGGFGTRPLRVETGQYRLVRKETRTAVSIMTTLLIGTSEPETNFCVRKNELFVRD
jgi:hypothetical protein